MTSTGDLPAIRIQQTNPSRIVRSPSHESVTTDLSLFSVSSVTSEWSKRSSLMAHPDVQRGPSPNLELCKHRLTVPARAGDRSSICDELFEEENDLIRSCSAISTVLGIKKSFSTSDISRLEHEGPEALRPSLSEIAIFGSRMDLTQGQLDQSSRSCSTWVAIGDASSTSQLPSPQGKIGAPRSGTQSPFTPVDFIQSVNKKLRQNYIRRRLISTYKALERFSQSELNLDHVALAGNRLSLPKPKIPKDLFQVFKQKFEPSPQSYGTPPVPVTVRHVERDRGKPLSKYERNMMIFHWLQTLDETASISIMDKPQS